MPGIKCSGLRRSEKELTERRSGAFHHKNSPGCSDVYFSFIRRSKAELLDKTSKRLFKVFNYLKRELKDRKMMDQ
jgi:hypothetical protein